MRLLWLVCLLLIPKALAGFDIVDPLDFNLDNGSFITILPNQSGSSINLYNSTDSPITSTLEISLNGTQIRYSSIGNVTLYGIGYVTSPNEMLFYNANGSGANLTTKGKMELANAEYQIRIDSVNDSLINSSGDFWLTIIKTVIGDHLYEAIRAEIIPPAIQQFITMTLTDVQCLGSLCESKIHIYSQDGTEIGSLKSTGSYMKLANQPSLKLILEKSSAGIMNDPKSIWDWIRNSWIFVFGFIFILDIIFATYFIIKNMTSTR